MLKLQGAQLALFAGCLCALLFTDLHAGTPAGTPPVADRASRTTEATAAAIPNPYDRRLASLKGRLEGATSATAAVLLADIYGLREFVTDAASVDGILNDVANDPQQPALLRDEARFRQVQVDLHKGKLAAADASITAMGFVRTWMVIGPLAVRDGLRGPEAGFQPGTTFTDTDGKAQNWRPLPASGPQPWVDASLTLPAGDGAVFAATALYSDRQQTVALRYSAATAATLFVNGRRLRAETEESGLGFDQHAVAAALEPGWNSIVFELRRSGQSDLRFGLRVSGLQGGGMVLPASTTAAMPQVAGASTQAQAATVAADANVNGTPADLLDIAKAGLKDANPKDANRSAAASETVGRLFGLRGQVGEALNFLEAAARLAPTAERWLAVAGQCQDSTCSFAALNAALKIDPENEPARLELARYYLSRHQLEKTRELLLEAITREPGDFAAGDGLADLYLAMGHREEALQQCERLEREFPRPLWLGRRLAARYLDMGLVDRAQTMLVTVAPEAFDDQQVQSLRLALYRRRRDAAGLRAVYNERLRIDANDTAALAALAALDSGSGDIVSAEQRLRQAAALAPGNGELRERLASLLARTGKAKSHGEMSPTQDANPKLENARYRLESAAAADGTEGESSYLADAAALAAAARRSPPAATGNAVRLAEIRIERVYENGLSAVRHQQVIYIATEQGAHEFSTRKLEFAPSSQDLRLLHARVYKPDGGVLEGEAGGDSPVADRATAMYYDVRARIVRFPALEKGDVIELDYRITPAVGTNPYGNYFGSLVTFRGATAQQLQRYVLITPAGRPFNILEQRMPPANVTMAGGERVYSWEVHDTAALPSEPKGPALTDVAPYVHVSTFQSWDELGRWYAQMIRPQFALDARLREQAARIMKEARTETERISAIHQFVLRNTHYVAMEFSVYSYKPYPVSQVYARRFGDCKDKAALMIALLREVGITADMALVRTRRLGEIAPQATSVALFNHAVVYVPKYDLWLDGTADYAGLRELPLDDQGAMALTVSADGRATLRRIPTTQPGDNYSRRTVWAQVMNDGRIQFAGVAYTKGEDAPGLRREYEIPEQQREAVRNSLAEVFPTVKLDDVRVDDANDFDRPVTVEFRGALDSFAGRRTVPLAASWMTRAYVQELAPLTSRSTDLMLPAPWTSEEELHFELPVGATVAAIPPDTVLETKFGTASIHFQSRGHELVINTSVQFRQLRITPAEYAKFREFCQQVERAFHDEIKVGLRG